VLEHIEQTANDGTQRRHRDQGVDAVVPGSLGAAAAAGAGRAAVAVGTTRAVRAAGTVRAACAVSGGGRAAAAAGSARAVGAARALRAVGALAGGADGSVGRDGGHRGVHESWQGLQVRADHGLADDTAHDGLDVHARRLHRGEDLGVRGRGSFLVAGDRLIRDQRQAEDLHAAVFRGDHLRDGGHAHGVATDAAQEAALGFRLVARSRHEAVAAVGTDLVAEVQSFAGLDNHLLEADIVGIADGGEAGAEGIVVDASERVIASKGRL
jgi:hypothetical protein